MLMVKQPQYLGPYVPTKALSYHIGRGPQGFPGPDQSKGMCLLDLPFHIPCHAYPFPHPPRRLFTTYIAYPIRGWLTPPEGSEPRDMLGVDSLYSPSFLEEKFSETELPIFEILGTSNAPEARRGGFPPRRSFLFSTAPKASTPPRAVHTHPASCSSSP